MGKASAKSQARRPVNYWSKFNDWWRAVLDETGRRPEAAAINKWYEENAADTWAPHEMPTVLETRVHAKCLRSVDEVRNYFRAYRAQRRADAMHGRDTGRDCGDEGDPDVPAPRGGSRRPGTAPSKTGTHKSGVTKVVASSGRSSRSLGGRAGSSQYGTEEYTTGTDSTWQQQQQQQQNSLDQTQMAHMAGSYEQHGGHMSLQHPPLQLPSQQHRVRIHIRQASAGSGSANVSSGAFTGASQPGGPMGLPRHPPLQHQPHQPHQPHYQHQHQQQHLHHHQMRNSSQLAHSPPDQGGVDGKEGRPDVQRGDMAYATADAPCSSVSTASLGDLLGLHDENDMALQDDAAYCAAMGLPPQHQQQGGSAQNALGSGAATSGGRGGRSGGSGPDGINLKQVMQQRHSAPTLPGLTDNVVRHGVHGNPQLQQQQQQAYPSLHSAQPHYSHPHPHQHQYQQTQQQMLLQQTQQQMQSAQQMPPSQQRSGGNLGDLGSIWDELDGAAEPTIYAQLTVLPRPNIKSEPQPQACTQQEQQDAGVFQARQHQQHHQMLHQQNQNVHQQQNQQQMHLLQMQQMQQNGSKPARVLWSPLLSARPMPVAPQQQQQQYAQNSGVVQHAVGMQGGQQCQAPQQMQQVPQQPPALPPFPSGWGLPPLEQQAQAPRISLNGSAVVPMDGVSCEQDAGGWTRDAAPPLPANVLMGTGGSSFGNGLSALQIKHEQHEFNKQPYTGPVGQPGSSSVAGLSQEPQPTAGSAPGENLELPMSQPSQPAPGPAAVHSLWASEQGVDTEMVASGVPAPQAPHNTPTWYTPHMQQQQQQSGQPHDAALQQRLLQLQSAGGSGSAGPSPLPTPTGPPSVSAPSAGQPVQSPSMQAAQQPQQQLPLASVPPLPPLPPFPPRHQPQQSAGPTPQPSQPPIQHQRSSSSNSGMMTPAWANQQPGHLGRPLSTSSSCSSWQSVPSAPASVQQPLPVPPSVPGSAASGPFSTLGAVRVSSWSGTPENSQGSGPATLPRPFDVSTMSQQPQPPSQQLQPQPQPQHQAAQQQSFQAAAVAMSGCPNTAFASQQQQNPGASLQQQQVPTATLNCSPVRVRRFSQPGPDEQSRLVLLQQHRHLMQEQQQAAQQAPQPQQTQTHMLPPSNSLPCVLPDIRTSMADAKMNSQAHGGGTGDGQTPAAGRHVVTTGNGTRPQLMRTLSAPPSETPSANAGAGGPFGDAVPLPQGHGTSGSGMALPGVTPRNQVLQAGGFGTPGLGMTSPAGWGGDSALAELEGDSAWLRNMLAPESLASSLWG